MTWRPQRGFRLGAMRERIDIQTGTDTVDSSGQPITAWTTTHSSEPASFEPTAGQETIRGLQVEAGISAVFVVRYRTGLVPQMRVVHSGTNYGIVHVKPVEGGRRFVELHCKAVT